MVFWFSNAKCRKNVIDRIKLINCKVRIIIKLLDFMVHRNLILTVKILVEESFKG